MRPQVVPHAGSRQFLLAPGAGLQRGAITIEVVLECHDATEQPFRDNLLHRDAVARVAALLVHGEHAPRFLAEPHQLLGLGHRHRERLVDDDVAPGQEALLRDGLMRRVGCSDDDEVDGPREQLVYAADELDVRITRVTGAAPLDDGRKTKALHGPNDGRVEDLACKAEAHHTHVEHGQMITLTRRLARAPRAPPGLPAARWPASASHAAATKHSSGT